jgi:hypothetical protein
MTHLITSLLFLFLFDDDDILALLPLATALATPLDDAVVTLFVKALDNNIIVLRSSALAVGLYTMSAIFSCVTLIHAVTTMMQISRSRSLRSRCHGSWCLEMTSSRRSQLTFEDARRAIPMLGAGPTTRQATLYFLMIAHLVFTTTPFRS